MKEISFKRLSAIIFAAVLMSVLSMSIAMAADLQIIKTSPKDGEKGQQMDNMSVKVYFNREVYSKKNSKANNKACVLVDKKGRKIPTTVLFSHKEKKVAVVVCTLKSTDKKYSKYIKGLTKYTLTISPDFKGADGSTLGKEFKTSYETLNPTTATKISMGMMALMVIVMVVASKRAMNKEKAGEMKKEKGDKVNPYKEAKSTGKSVKEIVERENKKKAKAARKQKAAEEEREDTNTEIDEGIYKLKKRASIAERGSKYGALKKTEAAAKKKAAEERRAKEEAWAKKAAKGKKKKK